MMKKIALSIGAVAALLIYPSFAMMKAQSEKGEEQARLAEAESAAREALDGFYRAFNAADNDALQDYCNYPHAFVGRNGSVRVIEDRWEMNFDAMREREAWAESTLDSARAFLVKEDKVHFEIVFSRHKADGSVYRTVPGLWIMTRQDGKWGLTLRSY